MVKGTAELERPVPLYMQVTRQLRAQIASGELAEGERIPSQREMMAHWHISMQTASKVIGALKAEGLAIASIGRDTVVAPGAAARIAAASAGTALTAAEPAPAPGPDVRAAAAMTAAPADVAEILGIPPGRRVLRRQETRIDGRRPLGITATWFPPAIAAQAPRLAEATGQRAARIHEENTAAASSSEDAALLGVPSGSPVLLTRTRSENASGQLIAYSEAVAIAGTWRSRTYTVAGS